MDKEIEGKNEVWEWAKAIGIALLLAAGIRYFLFASIVVEGASMMPTLENGDMVVVNKIGPRLTEYDRFDVVVFDVDEETKYIKRIIGLPGDRIVYDNDALFINGKKYEENYLDDYKEALDGKRTLTGNFTLEEKLGELAVPEGHYFVLGDNRRKSTDSRDPLVGFVEASRIVGTADVIFLPVPHLKIIE
ncbi:signal peptidase I [Planomicrobium sp. YIM 101495]|uniref:signal peptidase I n=1 Tax=Planomicrobium sp. YIM 101495 TaxID=2665160 RepID=UPI0012B99EAD|nr:signal peptidase I [Planomicrobium sp. YIM 101495]MTD32027.1 signal peptidase I [Planomicrobium sp. YIM 101495]